MMIPFNFRACHSGIAGRQGPGAINKGLWNMDSGLAATQRPGMTMWLAV